MNYINSDPARSYGEGILDLLTRTPDLVALFDADDRLRSANPAFCAEYHCDPAGYPFWQDIMRANFQNKRGPVIETNDIDAWLTIAAARRATVPYRCFEAELHGGKWIWITETVSPHGTMLIHASDISLLRRESRSLRLELDIARRASWTDPLTGVPNRRYVMERLAEWLVLQGNQDEFGIHTLIVLDLDHFKQINDQYGHDHGDVVLVSFCRKVVSTLRPFDLFGRIGGEEFLFLMPNCSLDEGRGRLERLQDMIQKSSENSAPPCMPFSFSAGLVTVQPDEDIHDTIRRADKLVFKAKSDGRARIRG